MSADKRLIEPRFKEAIDAWVEYARPLGGFLRAVLCNDLVGAMARGDDAALANLPHLVAYLYNDCPGNCWGSAKAIDEWWIAAETKLQALDMEDSAAALRDADRDAKDRHDDQRTEEGMGK